MLTNFVTIKKRLGLLDQLEAREQNGEFERLTKKEASRLTDEMTRLQRTLGGVRRMKRLPGALFVIDPHRERIAVTEARKLEIPIIGTGDTNVDPDQLDFIVPANDDAIRSIRLLCRLVADAAIEGSSRRTARVETEALVDGGAIEEPEEASDEMVAALAAGGTFSFEPEPDEDEPLLPGGPSLEEEAAPAAVTPAADEEERPARPPR
jgi:small subunit ribosomal protein S2